MRMYHYSVIAGHGWRLFQLSLVDHCMNSLTLIGKVMACNIAGSLYNKRVCLLYSVVKEHNGLLAYQSLFAVK